MIVQNASRALQYAEVYSCWLISKEKRLFNWNPCNNWMVLPKKCSCFPVNIIRSMSCAEMRCIYVWFYKTRGEYPPKLSEFLLLIPEITDWCWLLCQFQDLCRVSSDISIYFGLSPQNFEVLKMKLLGMFPFELSASSSQISQKILGTCTNACFEEINNLRWIWPSKCQSLHIGSIWLSWLLYPWVFQDLWKNRTQRKCLRIKGPGVREVLRFLRRRKTSKVNRTLPDPLGGFLKVVGFPNNHGVFLLKKIILGCFVFLGYHHLRKHPFLPADWISRGMSLRQHNRCPDCIHSPGQGTIGWRGR